MRENEITGEIIDSAITIHKELGPGLFESVYEEILSKELISKGLLIHRQSPLPVIWKGTKLSHGFRVDLIVENKVLIEIKSIETIADLHKKQLLTYLRLSGIKLGLLINFNVAVCKHGITRLLIICSSLFSRRDRREALGSQWFSE